jgi:hypothetical protein
MGDTFGARMRSFIRGEGLPVLAKSLLQSGQLYYLFVIKYVSVMGVPLIVSSRSTIPLNVVMVTMVFAPVSPVYMTMFTVPSIAFESAMACRVFRNVKFSGENADVIEPSILNLTERTVHQSGTVPKISAFKTSRRAPLAIEITQMTVTKDG